MKNENKKEIARLQREIEELKYKLQDANETLDAIRSGEVDALVVKVGNDNQVFTLSSAERPYRIFVEEMQQGALVLSLDGTIVYANRRIAEIFKQLPSSMLGTTVESRLAPESRESWRSLLAQAAKTRAVGDLEFALSDDSRVPIFMALMPCPFDGPPAICAVVNDLTEQKQYERLLAAEQALRENERKKDEVIAMLGHELSNQLAPIRHSVSLVRSTDSIRKNAQDMIERQVTHMARLIADLQDVSYIMQGKISLNKGGFDLALLIACTVADYRPLLEANDLQIDFTSTSKPHRALCDAARITQIVNNLLDNANKFTPRGGRVSIDFRYDGNQDAVLTVRDTGKGMDPATLSRLFRPFLQIEGCITRTNGGMGMGLALVKGLVELHGGRIHATSAGLGQGSEFTVVLPIVNTSGTSDAIPAPSWLAGLAAAEEVLEEEASEPKHFKS